MRTAKSPAALSVRVSSLRTVFTYKPYPRAIETSVNPHEQAVNAVIMRASNPARPQTMRVIGRLPGGTTPPRGA